MKDGFRRLLHKRGVGGIKNSQKMKFAFFDCFYVMLPLKKGVHYTMKAPAEKTRERVSHLLIEILPGLVMIEVGQE